MAISVVPVIYDHLTKKVLRWYLLDEEGQRSDPAFNPANVNERKLDIPYQIYRVFGRTSDHLPALIDIQNYVNASAP